MPPKARKHPVKPAMGNLQNLDKIVGQPVHVHGKKKTVLVFPTIPAPAGFFGKGGEDRKDQKKKVEDKKDGGKKKTTRRVAQKGGCGCSGAVMP